MRLPATPAGVSGRMSSSTARSIARAAPASTAATASVAASVAGRGRSMERFSRTSSAYATSARLLGK